MSKSTAISVLIAYIKLIVDIFVTDKLGSLTIYSTYSVYIYIYIYIYIYVCVCVCVCVCVLVHNSFALSYVESASDASDEAKYFTSRSAML